MKYEIEGTERITHTEHSNADTPRAAAREYFDKHKKWPETVTAVSDDDDAELRAVHEVATACESCGQAVFEGEEYYSGEDFDVCEPCGKAAQEAAWKRMNGIS